MTRKFAVVAAALAVFAFACQGVEAGEHKPVDKRLGAVAIGVGAASTAGYFALGDWHSPFRNVNGITSLGAWGLTTAGCAALSPMVATVVLNRPLTMREGHIMFASCVLPIIGGWLVNEAYNAHPEWDPAYRAPKGKKHAKKM